MQHVGISGEVGDTIYAFPAIRALGIKNVVNLDRPWVRPDWPGRSKSLKRLAESQDYISSFRDYAGEEFLDLTTYRFGGMAYGESIINRVARWARVSVDQSEPWLQVDPNPKTKGRIIIARCPRWKAYSWPYKALVARFQCELLFLGTDEEYKAFCAEFGVIERILCNDMLDVSQAIKGSELFIGNQSSPFAIAEGLKHPSVLEVCPVAPDCLTFRDNCTYSVDGELSFSVLGKSFQSEAMVQPYCCPAGNKYAYGRNEFECETVARTLYLLQKFPLPPIARIRSMIHLQEKAA